MTNIVTWPILHSVSDLGDDYRASIKRFAFNFQQGGEETENMFAVSEGRVLAIWLKHTGSVEMAQSARCLSYKLRDPRVSPRAHVKCQTWWCTGNPSTGERERGGLPDSLFCQTSLLDELQTSKWPCLKPPSRMRSGNQGWPLASGSTVIHVHPLHTLQPLTM